MSRQDRRAISISNSLDFGLKILVGDDRKLGLVGFAVGGAAKFEAFQVLGVGVSGKDESQHLLLDGVGVAGHFLDEAERLRVLLAGRRA